MAATLAHALGEPGARRFSGGVGVPDHAGQKPGGRAEALPHKARLWVGAGCEYNRQLLLEATGIEKRYGGVRALKHVSFDLRAGEVHALIGENGAGKSTLIKVLTGAVQADAGTVRLDGAVLEHNSPHLSRQKGIAAIYQQPAIFPDLTVAENIALVNEPGGLFRRVDWGVAARACEGTDCRHRRRHRSRARSRHADYAGTAVGRDRQGAGRRMCGC